jgi:hypothetical protein
MWAKYLHMYTYLSMALKAETSSIFFSGHCSRLWRQGCGSRKNPLVWKTASAFLHEKGVFGIQIYKLVEVMLNY